MLMAFAIIKTAKAQKHSHFYPDRPVPSPAPAPSEANSP
jgi:hypothetical protein